ncbi:MAG: alpha/beta fold hydrolase [Woeseiaceae bacterium]|jgi:pimeloyl-ACP methyl ester carboxylesterase
MYFAVNGKQVFATTGGKPFDNSKPTVIFLHGSGLDHTFWGLHARFFAFRNYSVLVPDLPGHTNSEGPPLTTIEAIADWLNDVVETLDINNISLVAHSQGCLDALEFASRFPERLKSVSFIASGLATPVNEALISAAENDPEAAIAMMLGWGFGPAGQLHQGPIPGNSMVAGGRKVMRGNVPTELAADLRACDAYKNGKQAAAAIKSPAQVILAGKDRMAPRKAGLELVAHLPDPEVTIIEESGHMVPQEAPDRCRQLLRDFIFKNNPTR